MSGKMFGKLFHGIRGEPKIKLDESVLRQAQISILTLDERWNNLFKAVKKTQTIIKSEGAINSHLKERSRLTAESNENYANKKKYLKQIMELSKEAHSNGGESAKAQIDDREAQILEINKREGEIQGRLDAIELELKDINISLLSEAVSYLYINMKKSRAHIIELDAIISGMREELKMHISERETINESADEIYHFLHGLLGAREIEKLDDHYSL